MMIVVVVVILGWFVGVTYLTRVPKKEEATMDPTWFPITIFLLDEGRKVLVQNEEELHAEMESMDSSICEEEQAYDACGRQLHIVIDDGVVIHASLL